MSFRKSLHISCNEAIAWGAVAANVNLVSHYPGSPVNKVEVFVKKLNERFNRNIKFNDALNEHVAALAAAGASYSGARTLVVMKHVGLNIAADPFNYIGYTGVKGGMVIIVGTDPGANSSTGEEDVHWFVPQFNFPLFEPTTVQECYENTQQAFELSELHEIPVLIFVPSRLAYNYEEVEVEVDETQKPKDFYFTKDRDRYINVGKQAVENHRKLIEKTSTISETYWLAKRHFNSKAKIGIVTRGLAYAIACEVITALKIEGEVELLNMDMVFPINKKGFNSFLKGKEEVIFIEDQDGFLEHQAKMDCFETLPRIVAGKNIFPKYGEITHEQIETFLSDKFKIKKEKIEALAKVIVPERMGTFCEGCPHTGSYYSIDQAIKEVDGIIGGDIGCSSLPPYRADWLLCMNAGIGISQGMAQVLENQTIISTGGDGSFFHAGALSLLSAIQNKIDLIHLVFDNGTIAMTGHQDSPSGQNFDHHQFLLSMGVDKVIDVNPYLPNDFTEKLKAELNGSGVRVFWVKGVCVIKGNDYIESRRNVLYTEIDSTKCGSCSKCYEELACPAILNLGNSLQQELTIDLNRCVRCGVCHEVCPKEAITINQVSS